MKALGVWLIMAVAAALAWAATRPPAPRPPTAGAFSASRAFADVQAMAREAHPTGSAAIEPVRRHVLQRLGELGVPAEIHAGEAARAPRWAPARLQAAAVQNVVGVLPGLDRALPAVMVAAHYDSVANSPGAADDAAGVAALLEIARVLAAEARAGRPPQRDVVFVATDAEEEGLLGAQAFFGSDPLARRVGVVVNMEARGDAGRAAMFQTGPRAGALVRLYARTAEHPYAASFTAFFASLLPNDTDFSVAREHGLGGLNLAFIGDQLAYHTPLSTPAHLQGASLQSLGGQALPAVRALAASRRLPQPSPDLAYADLPGLGVVAYPAETGGWLLCLLVAGAVLAAIVQAVRSGWVRAGGVAQGAAVALLAALAGAPLLLAAGGALGGDASLLALYRLLGAYPLLLAGALAVAAGAAAAVYAAAARADAPRVRVIAAAGLALCALVSLLAGSLPGAGLGTGLALLAGFALRRPLDLWGAWLGALAVGAGSAVVVQAVAPMVAPLVLWPLAPAALAGAAVFLAARSEATARLALALAALMAVLATALAGAWGASLFEALGPALPAVATVPVLLALPAVAPFLRMSAGSAAGVALAVAVLVAGLGALAVAALHAGAAARPAATIAFAVDETGGRSWRVAPVLDRWTRQVLGPAAQRRRFDLPGLGAGWAAPTVAPAGHAPAITASRIDGRLVVSLRPSAPARQLRVTLRADGLSDPRLDARPVTWPARSGARELRFSAPPPEGVTLSFAAPPHGRADVAAMAVSDGWGAPPPPPRPPGLMAFGDADTRMAVARAAIGW